MTEAPGGSHGQMSDVELEFYSNLSEVLMTLADVASEDYSVRITASETTGPFGALVTGLNEMLDVLESAHTKSREYQRELEEKLGTIDRQRAAIREMSTPVIQVWDGVLCLPVVGILDSMRSSEMTDALLSAIGEHKARFVIVDITGIEVMDTATADHFIRMAKAVSLLGAECVLSGIGPSIAQTLVHLGTLLDGLQSHRTLRDALQYCVNQQRRNERLMMAPRQHPH